MVPPPFFSTFVLLGVLGQAHGQEAPCVGDGTCPHAASSDSLLQTQSSHHHQDPERCLGKNGEAQSLKYGSKKQQRANLYCTPGSQRAVVVFVGSPPGNMDRWAKETEDGADTVCINLLTWDVEDIMAAVRWCKKSENAQEFGFSTGKVVLAGYSKGGINSHTAWINFMRDDMANRPDGVMWFNGVIRGGPLDDPKGKKGKPFVITKEVAAKILIIQGEKDEGFLAASVKYRNVLDKRGIDYAWAPNGATHISLMSQKGCIIPAVRRFLENLDSPTPAEWGVGAPRLTCTKDKKAKDSGAFDPNTIGAFVPGKKARQNRKR